MGSTIQAAAHTAGIHRSTIANWPRAASDFQALLYKVTRPALAQRSSRTLRTGEVLIPATHGASKSISKLSSSLLNCTDIAKTAQPCPSPHNPRFEMEQTGIPARPFESLKTRDPDRRSRTR